MSVNEVEPTPTPSMTDQEIEDKKTISEAYWKKQKEREESRKKKASRILEQDRAQWAEGQRGVEQSNYQADLKQYKEDVKLFDYQMALYEKDRENRVARP